MLGSEISAGHLTELKADHGVFLSSGGPDKVLVPLCAMMPSIIQSCGKEAEDTQTRPSLLLPMSLCGQKSLASQLLSPKKNGIVILIHGK